MSTHQPLSRLPLLPLLLYLLIVPEEEKSKFNFNARIFLLEKFILLVQELPLHRLGIVFGLLPKINKKFCTNAHICILNFF